MPKLKWRVADAPYMNDPQFTGDIEYEMDSGKHPIEATPDVVSGPVDKRKHVKASAGVNLNTGM